MICDDMRWYTDALHQVTASIVTQKLWPYRSKRLISWPIVQFWAQIDRRAEKKVKFCSKWLLLSRRKQRSQFELGTTMRIWRALTMDRRRLSSTSGNRTTIVSYTYVICQLIFRNFFSIAGTFRKIGRNDKRGLGSYEDLLPGSVCLPITDNNSLKQSGQRI